MKLKTVATSKNATLNHSAPRQDKTGSGGLPVRTNLRAGEHVGSDPYPKWPSGPEIGNGMGNVEA